ncbi:hypothetical protein FsymDg_1466 [Candidatus Protofrankia datiscae]|uniref:Uncharacterized protein n=1 Tax=Candidatus Protofrankia datiscae TaxID=2716812 RepID=F8B2V0_9ACTN|nr:hypothetical protein FsymDg_1466 [Candidatus Protofrankia datiscae]
MSIAAVWIMVAEVLGADSADLPEPDVDLSVLGDPPGSSSRSITAQPCGQSSAPGPP